MASDETRLYLDELMERYAPEFHAEFIDFPEAMPRECHDNAVAYMERHPGHALVRGWLVVSVNGGGYIFNAHSVVRRLDDGALLDVTPGNPARLAFVEHRGTDEHFEF